MNLSKTDKTLNAIIIDDERMARQELLRLLKKHPHIKVISQAENIDQGLEEIEQHQPDIIFLDIELLLDNIDIYEYFDYGLMDTLQMIFLFYYVV